MNSLQQDQALTEKKYKADPGYILREIAGEAILVPVGENAASFNGMISLNHTFKFIWEMFQEPHTIAEVAEAAGEQYDGEPEEIEKDIRDFVEESLRYNLLTEINS